MPYTSEILADSPLAYYRLGESSGTTLVDSSGNSHDGTYSGSYTLAQPGLVGDSDTAALFAGGVGSVAAFSGLTTLTNVTVEAWCKPTSVSGTKLVGGRTNLGGTSSQANYQMFLSQRNARWSVTVWSSSGNTVDLTEATDSAVVGKTQHVVGTYDGSALKLFVDGVEVASVAKTGSLGSGGTNPITIGGPNLAGLRFAGVIDEFAYYSTALTSTRIAAHFAAAASAPAVSAAPTSNGTALAAVVAVALATGALTSAGAATATVTPVYAVTANATSAGEAAGDVQSAAEATSEGTATADAFAAYAVVGSAASDGTATAVSLAAYEVAASPTSDGQATAEAAIEDGGVSALATSAGTATADVELGAFTVPAIPAAPNSGRTRTGYGVATWDPPVVQPPAMVAPAHARIAAHAYTSVTMNGTRPVLNGFTTADKTRHRDRVVIAGRDVTYYRGVATPLPKFGLVSPLLYGSGTLELPQVAACFETPGRGSLSWLRPGAPVLVQRVDPNTNTVIATDYKGIVLDFATNGRALTVTLGGDALGRASLRDKQPPIFKRRNDIGWWWWNALAGPDGLYRPFGKVGGPTTGINVYDTGGAGYVTYLNELAAKGVNLAGAQWTCDPIETGPNAGTYRVYRKNLETITGTAYLDDAHTVASLQADVAEQPNRIFGTGVTPRGERAKFGVYPVLAEKQRARFPNYLDPRPIQEGDTNADTDTGGGVTALLHRLSVTGYLSADAFAGGYDSDVTAAARDLQDDAGLPKTGEVNQATWDALFDVNVVGYSTRGSRIEPIAQLPKVRRVRRNASGQVIGRGLFYNPQALPIDRTFDFGTGVTRGQMREWSRSQLHQERHWTGTITFELGALIDGEHTPGDPLTASDLIPARALRPGHNLWLPLFDGGTLVHVSGVDVNSAQQVVVAVDTRARDTMTVWEVIARNQDNKRNPARAWIKDHRSSSGVKDAVTEFDEIGGTITDTDLDAGWTVFPVVAGQEGTIARLRMRLDKPAEYVVAVFGRRIAPKRLAGVIGNPLEHAGAKRWSDPDRLDKLVGDRVLLYVAGDDQAPCGYYPGTKETETYTPQVPNPDYNVDVAPDNPAYNNQETLNEQIPNPNYNPADPENDQEFIDKVVTEQKTPVTGRWVDDAGFGYRTFDQSCVLWVAVYVRRPRTLQGGRIMWPQLESGS